MYLISSIPGGHLALWVALIAVVCGTIPACQGPRNPKHADQSPPNPPAQAAPPQGGAPAASARSAEPRVEHDAVVLGNARFGLLGEGIVRLEFAPDGRFDDRPTFRAITMPAPLPFDKIQMVDGELVLTATGIELRYRPPEPSSMRITWQAGGIHGVWSPGAQDAQNLGSVGTMDHVGRAQVPHGIHPANAPGVDRYGEKNLATTIFDALEAIKKQPDFKPPHGIEWGSVNEYFDLLPADVQRLYDYCRKFPPGAVSRAGYTVLDETGLAFYDPQTGWIDRNVRPDYQNLFFFCYGHDYGRALRQFTALCGRIPMVPRWALGAWFSCYEDLSGDDNRRIVEEFARNGIPLDVLILDMDWHTNGWNGWDWKAKNYPDPAAFLKWAAGAGVHVALNLHNESISRADSHFREICKKLGVGEDVKNPEHVHYLHGADSWTFDYTDRAIWQAVCDVCLRPDEQQGVDFWWLDNWQGIQDGYNSVLWLNHLVCRHMEQELGRRPIILGRYSGFGSHRYPAYFSGDTASQWEVLQSELETNLRAGQIGMDYFSHDLGGFKGPVPGNALPLIDPELYVRWMQMGALSPVMRVHSDHGSREPWKYGPRVLEIVRGAYELHTRLSPYFYQLGREAYDTGAPIHRPLYFLFPEDAAAYDVRDQYFLGDRILAAPVAEPGGRGHIYIPAGQYFQLSDGELLKGPLTLDRIFPLDEIPLFVRAGSIIPQQDPGRQVGAGAPDPLVLAVYPGGADRLDLYEDDSVSTAYQKDSFSRREISLKDETGGLEIRIAPTRGSFAGMPAQRTVRIEANFVPKPSRVTVRGVGEAPWTYDDRQRRCTVTLLRLRADEAVDIRIER